MKVGDLVQIKPHVQPPHLYGIGLVIGKQEAATPTSSWPVTRIRVRWSKLPHKVPMWLRAASVELVNENR